MRRLILLGIVASWLLTALPAIAESDIPQTAFNEKTKLLGRNKAAYLMRQLDLTEQQAAHAQGLIESILPADENIQINPDEIRRLYKEIEAAKAAGDKAKVDELAAQLQQMGKDATDDSEFYDNIASQLTDEQKAKLVAAQARLDNNPSGSLRPVDMVRIARDLNPTSEQQTRMRDAQEAMRKILYPVLRPNMKMKSKMVNFLHDEIRAILTEEQRPQWDYRIRVLRPDLIDEGLRVSMEPPAEDPPADE
jgi:uncharacterized tellurite resistance protein B-like protein